MSGEPKPWYGLLLFLSGGIYLEANNISGGKSANSLGVNLTLGVHFGYYTCLKANLVHLSDTGYMYTTPGVSFLETDGAMPVHNYYLKFSGEDDSLCTGTIEYAIFPIGSNPFVPKKTPFFVSGNGTASCYYLNGKDFIFPKIG